VSIFSLIKTYYASLKNIISFIEKNWIKTILVHSTKTNIIKFLKRLPLYSLILLLVIIYLVYKILEKIIIKLVFKIGIAMTCIQFGILKACYRCTYGKSRERLIIISGGGYDNRQGKVLIIIDHKNKKVYFNKGDCIGINNCNRCIEDLNKDNLPCYFKEIKKN